jgi:hypothetical protein
MINPEEIIVVSGLPRSGTSMMMKMLAAGGVELLTDELRKADEDNPQGYYELEQVKSLEKNSAWLAEGKGKAVKIISGLLKHLPQVYNYQVIFMHRKMSEVLASQREMVKRSGKTVDNVSDERMGAVLERHLQDVERWIAQQPNIETVHIDYNDLLDSPAQVIEKLNRLLDGGLKTQAMAAVIDHKLYRQRD